jgi:hypothetical protein
MAEESQNDQASGISFPAFVLSLAHTTAVHLGDVPDPMTGQALPPNLPAAQQMIEILMLLEEKTRGNLTAEERQLMEQLLYELRMRFVQVRGGGGVSPQPESRADSDVPPSGSRTPSGIIIP